MSILTEYDEAAAMEHFKKDGWDDGWKAGIRNIALNMKKENVDIEMIEKCTGLSKEEIEKL